MPDFRLRISDVIAMLCSRAGCAGRYFRALDRIRAKHGQPVSVLFLCRGNICRSPYAALSFARLCQRRDRGDIQALSAGLDTTPGKAADPQAVAAAARRELDLSGHRTTAATRELLEQADLIVIMDENQRVLLKREEPKVMEKTVFLGAFLLAEGFPLTIEDPYAQGPAVFDRCFEKIDRALENLLGRING